MKRSTHYQAQSGLYTVTPSSNDHQIGRDDPGAGTTTATRGGADHDLAST